MRFIMLVKASPESETGALPSKELVVAMGQYNESLMKAGVLLAAEGLHPSSRGTRVTFSGEKRTVIDGPFTEAKELIAGFWLIQVRSREEAIEWASRVPFEDGVVEIREIFEASDFPPDVLPPEQATREEEMRQELRGSLGGRE